MNIINALGIKDTAEIKFPAGIYTTKNILRGENPFAVIFESSGKTKISVGKFTDGLPIKSKIVID